MSHPSHPSSPPHDRKFIHERADTQTPEHVFPDRALYDPGLTPQRPGRPHVVPVLDYLHPLADNGPRGGAFGAWARSPEAGQRRRPGTRPRRNLQSHSARSPRTRPGRRRWFHPSPRFLSARPGTTIAPTNLTSIPPERAWPSDRFRVNLMGLIPLETHGRRLRRAARFVVVVLVVLHAAASASDPDPSSGRSSRRSPSLLGRSSEAPRSWSAPSAIWSRL